MADKPKRPLFDRYLNMFGGKPLYEAKESLRKTIKANLSPSDVCDLVTTGWNNDLIIDQYVEDGGDVDARQAFGHENYTLLHICVRFSHIEFIERLLYYGANIDAISVGNTTPLCLAITWREIEVVKLLLKADPDIKIFPNERNRQYTNLAELVLSGRGQYPGSNKEFEDIADLLLEYEASKLDIKRAGNRR